jgi:hypothetical protein
MLSGPILTAKAAEDSEAEFARLYAALRSAMRSHD